MSTVDSIGRHRLREIQESVHSRKRRRSETVFATSTYFSIEDSNLPLKRKKTPPGSSKSRCLDPRGPYAHARLPHSSQIQNSPHEGRNKNQDGGHRVELKLLLEKGEGSPPGDWDQELYHRHGNASGNPIETLPFELFTSLISYFTERECCLLQQVCHRFRCVVQHYAKITHNGALTISGIQKHSLPEERLDLWNFPTAPPQLLPQSVLHGRCGALLQLVHGSVEEDISTTSAQQSRFEEKQQKTCMRCGYSAFDLSERNQKSKTSQTQFSTVSSPHTFPTTSRNPENLFQSNRNSQRQQEILPFVNLQHNQTARRRRHQPLWTGIEASDSAAASLFPLQTQFGSTEAYSFKPGRLLICGGYGMFELWDHNVTMRCNEIWELGLHSQIWRLQGGMLEEELLAEWDLRFEDRDSVSFVLESGRKGLPPLSTSLIDSSLSAVGSNCRQEIGSVVRLIVFGQVCPTNSYHRVFNRISITNLGNYFNANDTLAPHNEGSEMIAGNDQSGRMEMNRVSRHLLPFSEAHEFIGPTWHHYEAQGKHPERRECFASCLYRAPSKHQWGQVLIYGGYAPNLTSLDDLYLLELPTSLSERNLFHQRPPPIVAPTWTLLHRTTQLKTQGPCGRFGHSMTVIGTRVFVFGGKTEAPPQKASKNKRLSPRSSSILLADLWVLEKTHHNEHDEWEWFTPECNGSPPSPRTSHRAIAVGCHLLVFAGFATNRYVNDLYVLSTSTFTWTIMDFMPSLQRQLPSGSPRYNGSEIREAFFSPQRVSQKYIEVSSPDHESPTPPKMHTPYLCDNSSTHRYPLRRRKKKNMADEKTTARSKWTTGLSGQSNRKRITPIQEADTERYRPHFYFPRSATQVSNTFNSLFPPVNQSDQSSLLSEDSPASSIDASPSSSSSSLKITSNHQSNHLLQPFRFTKVTKLQKFIPRYFTSSESILCPSCQFPNYSDHEQSTQHLKPLSFWITPRMEPSMIYDGDHTVIIFGGSSKFRWNPRQLRFDDFCADLYSIHLDIAE